MIIFDYIKIVNNSLDCYDSNEPHNDALPADSAPRHSEAVRLKESSLFINLIILNPKLQLLNNCPQIQLYFVLFFLLHNPMNYRLKTDWYRVLA